MTGTNTPGPDAARTRRAETLRKAAADKHDQAVSRAEAGIRTLLKDREDINFRSVARAAGVSRDFLYSQPQPRNRGRQQHAVSQIRRLLAKNQPVSTPHAS